VIKKINAVKNFNTGKKLRKPAMPTVNTNILKSNVFSTLNERQKSPSLSSVNKFSDLH